MHQLRCLQLLDPDVDPEVVFQGGSKEDENEDDDDDVQVRKVSNDFGVQLVRQSQDVQCDQMAF